MSLLRITTPDAVGGLVVEPGGFVTTAAPFLEEFLGVIEPLIRAHCKERGWTVETVAPVLEDASRPDLLKEDVSSEN